MEKHAPKFGDSIAAMRRKKRIKQKEFAKSLYINPSYLSTLERGGRNPNIKLLYKMAVQLEIAFEDFMLELIRPQFPENQETDLLFKQSRPIIKKCLQVLVTF